MLSKLNIVIALAVLPLTTQTAVGQTAEALNVAAGSSIVGYLKTLKPKLDSQGVELSMLREDGMGADNVIVALDQGKAQIGIIGTSWEDASKMMKEKKTAVGDLARYQSKVIGQDRLLFVTYKGGPKELSAEQLKKLFTGAATNWKDVGGEDAPVQIVLHGNSPATQKMVSERILGGADFQRKGIKIIGMQGELVKHIANTKGAVGFIASRVERGEVNVVKGPEMARPITAITIGAPKPAAAKLMDAFQSEFSK